MNLSVIVNAWADTAELLPHCINNYLPVCDNVIVVYSNQSNRGNVIPFMIPFGHEKVKYFQYEPVMSLTPLQNETRKRNFGIQKAKELEATHFLMSDADEFYEQASFEKEKERMEALNLNGLVCKLLVYIKEPTLSCEDHTLVPFIHKLLPNTCVGVFKYYPYAIDRQGNAHIDPSRRINYTSRIEMSSAIMHHYSYVRQNIELKIENSSANLRKSAQAIRDELRDAKPGYLSKLYHRELVTSPNLFNLSSWK
jgi:hypothetical protein